MYVLVLIFFKNNMLWLCIIENVVGTDKSGDVIPTAWDPSVVSCNIHAHSKLEVFTVDPA